MPPRFIHYTDARYLANMVLFKRQSVFTRRMKMERGPGHTNPVPGSICRQCYSKQPSSHFCKKIRANESPKTQGFTKSMGVFKHSCSRALVRADSSYSLAPDPARYENILAQVERWTWHCKLEFSKPMPWNKSTNAFNSTALIMYKKAEIIALLPRLLPSTFFLFCPASLCPSLIDRICVTSGSKFRTVRESLNGHTSISVLPKPYPQAPALESLGWRECTP